MALDLSLWAYSASFLEPVVVGIEWVCAPRWLKCRTGIAQRERQIVRTAIGGTLVGFRVPEITAQFDSTCGHIGLLCRHSVVPIIPYFQDLEQLEPRGVNV